MEIESVYNLQFNNTQLRDGEVDTGSQLTILVVISTETHLLTPIEVFINRLWELLLLLVTLNSLFPDFYGVTHISLLKSHSSPDIFGKFLANTSSLVPLPGTMYFE